MRPTEGADDRDGSILSLRDLRLRYGRTPAAVEVLRGIDLDLREGEILGIVGESGSGKSQLLLSIVGLLADGARLDGAIRYRGQNLVGLSPRRYQPLRGREIAVIFQDPMSSLNPFMTVGAQVAEAVALTGVSRAECRREAIRLLADVGIRDPERRVRQHPHAFSGGMLQRVAIAMALAARPTILLADEPTTALDVSIQAQVLAVIKSAVRSRGMSCIFVTHDLGVVAAISDRVAVVYHGRIVEVGGTDRLFADPRHPYTAGLLASTPTLEGPRARRLPFVAGLPPRAGADLPGCAFAPRCPKAFARCEAERPDDVALGRDGRAACHLLAPADVEAVA